MTRVICECDPPRPSECRISPGAARKRGTTVRQLRSSLRGDLDNIVMMALRKEPARRYGLVQTLSEDLERYLQSRPVLARRDTRAYRLSKFAQRHRSALSLAAVLAIVAIGFLASTLRARQRAEREAAKVAAVNEFLQGVLGSVNPARGGKAGVTVLEAIDQALVRVDDAFRDQPELEAAVRNTIGSTLTSLGEYAAAERELERALALRRRLQGDRLGDVGETLYKLALVSYQKGSYDETLSLLEEAAAIQRSHLGNRHPALARTLDMQALVAETRGEWDRAETLYRESLDVKRNALGEENGEVARSLTALAEVSAQRGAVGEAEERFRHALELQRRIQSRELPETLDFFAKLLTRTGRLDEAHELLREAEELQRKRYGADHPAIARNLQLGGQLRHAQGRHREALARYEEAVAMFREFLGERHHVVAEAQSDYGECLADVGDYRAAEAQLLAARSALLESFGPHHPETRRAEERLSRVRSERPEGRLRAGVRGAR
jgi:tetratricopeptide (TPR) repeat protein